MIKRLLIFFIFMIAVPVSAATYNHYFDADATDDTGAGTIGDPWKTLSKAETMANAYTASDTVNLYFDGGDTWTEDTEDPGADLRNFRVDAGEARVNILSYGTGRAIFDGGMAADFAGAAEEGVGNAHKYNRFFEFQSDNCSITNVIIHSTYGNAITLKGGDYFTLSNSELYNIGFSAVNLANSTGGENNTVEYNIIRQCMQLERYGVISLAWTAAIAFSHNDAGAAMCKDNIIRYNLMYDIYGEGIFAPNSLIEYNIVGDTASNAIDLGAHAFDNFGGIARYNLVVMSDWSSSVYDGLSIIGQASPNGIRVYDEMTGGDNSAAGIEIYGNTIINRSYGIRMYCSAAGNSSCGQTYGSVKIYNNLIIDSHVYNVYIANPDEFTSLYFYNNASIFYDCPGTNIPHINLNGTFPASGWDESHNAYWSECETHSIDSDFQTAYVTTDPELPGDASVNWDGLTGSYWYGIEYTTHLYPTSGALIGAGFTPIAFTPEATFLTTGSDFSDVLSWPTGKVEVEQAASWDIGPWARGGAAPASTLPLQGAAGDFKYN